MKAGDALDIHTQLLDTLEPTVVRAPGGAAMAEPSELGSYVDYICTYQLPEVTARTKRYPEVGPISSFVGAMIKAADTFLVSADVVAEIHGVADGIGEEELLDGYRAPKPFGFAVLETPLYFLDHRGLNVGVHMIAWGETETPGADGKPHRISLVALWSDVNRERCEMLRLLFEGMIYAESYDMDREFRGFYPLNILSLRGSERAGPRVHQVDPETRAGFDDVDLKLMAEKGIDPDAAVLVNLDRLVCALWELMNRIPEAELAGAEHVNRYSRKRAQAAGRAAPVVRAVRLHSPRRPADPDKPKGESTWTPPDHVVEVHGHWRNQACGPGRKERKRIWIEDYKWNEDAENPAPATPTVYVVK